MFITVGTPPAYHTIIASAGTAASAAETIDFDYTLDCRTNLVGDQADGFWYRV